MRRIPVRDRAPHHAVDQDAEGNPEEEGEGHHWAHDVVSQELPERVDVQFIDEVPEPLHHVLHLLHALPLHTEVNRWFIAFIYLQVLFSSSQILSFRVEQKGELWPST